ncbi:MAG: RNA polymerase sigma factor [Bryobacteraceae bacterium]
MRLQAAIESVFREERSRIIATLIRLCGSFDRAEEAMQEAFASALSSWPEKGIPIKPAAWITAVAERRLIDASRREATQRDKTVALAHHLPAFQRPEEIVGEDEMQLYPDDRLRLIFTCCHPALNPEAQIALTLRTLGGLTTGEIARAFLIPEPTLAQRLVRAKRKIQDARIPYEVPPRERISVRLDAVRGVIYLIFNEGYSSTTGDRLVRADLCREAIRLGRMLCELMPDDAENLGLLALMLIHDSRRNARITSDGHLVTLEEQDRSLWDQEQARGGIGYLNTALRLGSIGPYQLQAAIAAVHAEAEDASQTDWGEIAALYRELSRLNPSAVVALNHAVAVGMSAGFERGLAVMDEIDRSKDLDGYYLLHAARADLLRRLGRKQEAASAYNRALELVTNGVEREYLNRRLKSLDVDSEPGA